MIVGKWKIMGNNSRFEIEYDVYDQIPSDQYYELQKYMHSLMIPSEDIIRRATPVGKYPKFKKSGNSGGYKLQSAFDRMDNVKYNLGFSIKPIDIHWYLMYPHLGKSTSAKRKAHINFMYSADKKLEQEVPSRIIKILSSK